ncbi:hypothetical protein [Acinetobacter higginsii]|uniref:hypothetical protein n=1 Tax=Acinetobacter higginsii TaxID=70347 RepID=UPI001F4A91DD|nr:hypothetical protein [Acinetobacter higginsii]MCH7341588.1 hypothetical protein [Acinetobacter higginsii]
MSYSAKFIVRYRHQSGHWANFDGAKYRIVSSNGKVLHDGLTTNSDGETIVVQTSKKELIRIELFNLKKNEYELPADEVRNCSVETKERMATGVVNVVKGYFQVKFKSPHGINLEKNIKYSFEFKPTGYKSVSTSLWGLNNGLTKSYDTDGPGMLEGGYPRLIKSHFKKLFEDTNPLVRIHLTVNKAGDKVATSFSQRVIPLGSKFEHREIDLGKVFWEDKTQDASKNSQTIANRLKDYRKVVLNIIKQAGVTYVVERLDKGEIIAPSLQPQNAITWQDGREVTIQIPKKFKGTLIIRNLKNKNLIGKINVGKFGNENEPIIFGINKFALPKKSEASGTKKLKEDAKQGANDIGRQKEEFFTYMISTNCKDQVFKNNYDLDDLRKCSDREFSIIVNAIFTNFVWDNGVVPIFASISSGSKDIANNVYSQAMRDQYIDKYLIPFFRNIGVAAKDILIAIKIRNGSVMIFFLGLAHLRYQMNMTAIRQFNKKIVMNSIPVKEPITWKSIKAGAIVGVVITSTSEIIEYFSTDSMHRDFTNLLATLTGIAIKAIVGTVITTLLTSAALAFFVGATAPFLAVVGVGLVIGFVIGFMLDSLDSYYLNMTGTIKDVFNRVQNNISNCAKFLIEAISKASGINYTVPSWILN